MNDPLSKTKMQDVPVFCSAFSLLLFIFYTNLFVIQINLIRGFHYPYLAHNGRNLYAFI